MKLFDTQFRSGVSFRLIFSACIFLVICALCAACSGDSGDNSSSQGEVQSGGSSVSNAGGSSSSGSAISIPWGGASVADIPAADTWVNGSLTSANPTQWFKFTATVSNQHIYFAPGTMKDVLIQVYTGEGTPLLDDELNLFIDDDYGYWLVDSVGVPLNVNQVYYISVWAYSSSQRFGTYQIAITKSSMRLGETFPASADAALTAGAWSGQSFTSAGAIRWFKFTASAATQYIHFNPGAAMQDVIVQVFTAAGTAVGGVSNLYSYGYPDSDVLWVAQEGLTAGQEYYIRVWACYPDETGSFMLGVTGSETPPSL